jgi:hypothetical protein
MSCVGKVAVLEKTASTLETVGRLRHGDGCGRKQSDRRTSEHENEDSLHRKKKAWAHAPSHRIAPETPRN